MFITPSLCRPGVTRRACTLFGGLWMLCNGCADQLTSTRAGARQHHCRYTGCQVAPFAFDCTDSAGQCRPDDPHYLCPRTLDRLLVDGNLGYGERNMLIAGVLETVAQRGELQRLLAT